jgi:hypothetical protein
MDNVQNCDSYVNIPSSQTYRPYEYLRKFSLVPLRKDMDQEFPSAIPAVQLSDCVVPLTPLCMSHSERKSVH